MAHLESLSTIFANLEDRNLIIENFACEFVQLSGVRSTRKRGFSFCPAGLHESPESRWKSLEVTGKSLTFTWGNKWSQVVTKKRGRDPSSGLPVCGDNSHEPWVCVVWGLADSPLSVLILRTSCFSSHSLLFASFRPGDPRSCHGPALPKLTKHGIPVIE
jgi:hypothetical protein